MEGVKNIKFQGKISIWFWTLAIACNIVFVFLVIEMLSDDIDVVGLVAIYGMMMRILHITMITMIINVFLLTNKQRKYKLNVKEMKKSKSNTFP